MCAQIFNKMHRKIVIVKFQLKCAKILGLILVITPANFGEKTCQIAAKVMGKFQLNFWLKYLRIYFSYNFIFLAGRKTPLLDANSDQGLDQSWNYVNEK